MPRNVRLRRTLAAGFALAALALNLIVIWGSSSGGSWFMAWGFLNIVPYFLSMFIAGNPHSGSEAVICMLSMIQWAVVGYLVGRLFE